MQIKDAIKERLGNMILEWKQQSARRTYFSISPKDIRQAAGVLFTDLKLRFNTATGIDTPAGIEIIYHFSFDQTGEIYSVRVLLEDRKNPKIDSLAVLFPAAEWIEREMWEMLGIDFTGHPNMKRLLLSDEWPEGKYPLRKK